ncbi:RND multidrug efflux transporter [Anaerovibrio sp. JC8]|uniref:efflux RND transporter permease subunit n=1 Tax=Anaerovibrio sp. JC8 TaxID=1240085 RepID=UPI000A0D2BB7|nr:efflux RND transporter permease subunit [Anaerovibrio sp. JC8]ORT99588.1 RND multidrug efflux transporter [Anaerovibrio sp. JC8]
MNLSEISIKRPVFATVTLVALVILGIVGYFQMSINENPETNTPFVNVSVTYDGAQPEQVDAQVTKRIEEAIGEARGVKHITSVSRAGSAEINVEFNIGVDAATATQEIRDKVGAVREELPTGVKEPVISRYDENAAAVVSYAITMDEGVSRREASIFIEDVLKPRLQKINGVGKFTVTGEEKREIKLLLDQDKLNMFGLSISDINNRLTQANNDIPAGKIKTDQQELSVRTAGNFTNINEFNQVVLGKRNNVPIYFHQVGIVKDYIKEADTTARYDGEQALGIEIGKQSGANAVQVATAVKKEMEAIQDQIPKGMKINLVRDDAARISDSIHEVWFDLLVGGIFAVIIVLWFLGDWQSTLISALAIPVSIVSTFFFMKLAGFSINTMSLLGLSLSVGLLIDDAIVVIENIIRHRRMGKDPLTAAAEGTKEISLAVMATTFTVVAVFVPVGIMSGMTGEYVKEFGLSIAFAMLVSLFVSFTLTPMMAAHYLPVGEAKMPALIRTRWRGWQIWFARMTNVYGEFLARVLAKYKKRTLAAAGGVLLLSLLLIPFLGSTFMPSTDQAQFTATVQSAGSDSPQAVDEQTRQLTAAIQDIPEIAHIYVSSSNHQQNYFIKLKPKKERSRSQKDVIAEVRSRWNKIPGVKADFIEDYEKPVAVSITGENMEDMAKAAEKIQKYMEEKPELMDVSSTYNAGLPNLNLTMREAQAGDLGVSTEKVGSTIQTMLEGKVIGKFSDGDDRVDIRLQLNDASRSRTDMLHKIFVPSEKMVGDRNMLVPLSQVAKWDYTTTASDIRRYDRMKEIRLSANINGSSLGDVNDEIYNSPIVTELPAGVSLGGAGATADMDESFSSFRTAILLAVAFIFMIMAAQFESYLEPFAIMFSLPLAVIGALVALFVTGSELSLISFIGIMMLMGLVTKNAILLIDFAKQQMAQGVACNEALVMAGKTRLRPILMTSMAMIFGMLPIALGLGPGAEMRSPMAYVVIGGIITSTILTLIVVPVVYAFITSRKAKRVPLAE